jgi:hypothetical protein
MLLFSVLPFTVNAAPAHTIELSFSENAGGKTVISLILSEPKLLAAIDFTLTLSSGNAVIETFDTEDSDLADKFCDFDDISEDSSDKEIFTYTTKESEKRISFSGFFLNSFSATKTIHLCDITINSVEAFSSDDIFEFTYTLTGEDYSKTESRSYSLLHKDLCINAKKQAFSSGDADLDGKVNSTDARRILRASVGIDALSLEEYPYADTDYDGKITATDARFSLRLSVGLENAVIHSFDISLEDGKKCEEGGNYTFTCKLTGKSFTMVIPNGGHITEKPDCLNTGNCTICNEIILPALGHNFGENKICTECKADKNLIDEATAMLTPLLEEIHLYDTLAEESLQMNKYRDFIAHSQEATKSIKKAADICDGITGMEKVNEHLMTAYSVRFQAFASIMDENGNITANAGNCNAIRSAVAQSKEHIDYASDFYVE